MTLTLKDMTEEHDKNFLKDMCHFLKTYEWFFNFSNIDILQESEKWCPQWMEIFQTTPLESAKNFFQSPNGAHNTIPQLVRDFVQQRNRVVQDFEKRYIEVRQSEGEVRPRLKKGLSPKKEHEVVKFGAFINTHISGDCDRIIDVGSGAGHLERYLLQVWNASESKCELCCVESEPSQLSSADKWANRTGIDCQKHVRSIIAKLEKSTFEEIEKQVGSNKSRQALIGLHACGDLTNTMLSWFVSSPDYFSKLSVISCCYHKMTTFPISGTLRNTLVEDVNSALTSVFARRLGAQDPFSVWYQRSLAEQNEHAKCFGRRAILQTLVGNKNISGKLKKKTRHGVRNGGNISNEEFLAEVERTYDFDNQDQVMAALGQKLEMNYDWLEVFSGFQAFLQLPLEYLIMLDKLLYLRESLPERNPKLVRIFDASISPRCLLLYCD